MFPRITVTENNNDGEKVKFPQAMTTLHFKLFNLRGCVIFLLWAWA